MLKTFLMLPNGGNVLRIFLILLVSILGQVNAQELYTQTGTDRTWEQVLAAKEFPLLVNSTQGVLGSTIDVNNALVEPESAGSIVQGIKIHTLCNSQIPRSDFPKWTRWYQEDGKTQVFRLHEGEYNVRNTRTQAARVEAFSNVSWSTGGWHEWVGTYTIVKPHSCAIFQLKNPVNDWALQLNLNDNGDITLNHRRHQDDQIIARNMTGKSFEIGIRDNGYDYEVYLNGKKVGAGYFDRPEKNTAFRWGMYLGANDVRHEAMIFVSGATVDPVPGIRDNIDTLTLSTSTIGFGTIYRTPNSPKYALNANVSLNAEPASGWKFKNWSGDVTSSDNLLNLVMTGEKNIVAVFESTEDKAPYNGTPNKIPGTIEAEDYDFGGESISYHDYDIGNLFNQYRYDGVDIELLSNGALVISNIYPNEWLEYSVDVEKEGLYDFKFNYASGRAGGKLGAEIVGSDTVLFSDFSVPRTINWNNYRSIVKEEVWLDKGIQQLRINFEREGYTLDNIQIAESGTLGNDKTQISNLPFYPNPTQGKVQLREIKEWKLYSLSGTLLHAGLSDVIDLTKHDSGIYIINIKDSFHRISKL